MTIEQTILSLHEAMVRLEGVRDRKSFTIDEIKKIRRIVLDAVREGIDPFLGHMPDKRHY